MNKKLINPIRNQRTNNTRILAENCFIENDTKRTGLNNNDLIIGPSGAGKTRGYVLPNILHANESLIIVDTKGRLHKQMAGELDNKGFDVQILDFANPKNSTIGYNPMDFIERTSHGPRPYSEEDVETLVGYLAPVESCKEPFWDISAQLFLASFVAYALEALPANEQHLGSVATIAKMSNTKEVSEMYEEWGRAYPDSFAYNKWKLSNVGTDADRTIACVRMFCCEKMSPFEGYEIQQMFLRPSINFEKLGESKTALFVNISDTDRSCDKLVGLLYQQAFNQLCKAADRQPSGRLKVPVRFIMDDFAAGTRMENFDKMIATIRSRDIYTSIILQSLSQLEGLYGKAAAGTIVDNCDTCLYLGGLDISTCHYIAQKADVPTSQIINLPVGNGLLFVRGQKPRQITAYNIENDELYSAIQESEKQLKLKEEAKYSKTYEEWLEDCALEACA